MRPQQVRAYANFIQTIAQSQDLDLKAKLMILNEMADEMYCQDENLLFLEVKGILKELGEKRLSV